MIPLRRLALLGLLAGLAACSDGGADPARSISAELRSDLQVFLNRAVASKASLGAGLHVATADGSTWSAAAGIGDVETDALLTSDDRFRAASILKTMVATAVLKAAEAGALGLGDTLPERLPPSVTTRIKNADRIRIDMLLGHRSGIPDWIDDQVSQAELTDPEHVYSLDEMLAKVANLPPVFEPGQDYGYSNTNYVLLGEILSGVSGRSWREVLRDEILTPCGLDRSSLPEPGDSSCPAPCAHGYVAMHGELFDTTRVDPSMTGAAGGHALLTTPADLTRFFQQLRRGALFEHSSTLDAMFDFKPDPRDRYEGYGFGVMKSETSGGVALGHYGETSGYQSFMLYLPATDRYVSGFINGMGDLDALLRPVLSRLAIP